mgnify:CR=1 FL=1
MATIKLEILLDSNEQTDALAFSNLMNAFSGTPAIQLVTSKQEFPLEALKRSVEAQSTSTQVTPTEVEVNTAEIANISEDEMLAMPNTDLKDYATSLGIDWAKAEGKNTNRKLANLILEFRDVTEKVTEEAEAEEVASYAAEVAEEEAPTETAEDLTAEDDLVGEKLTYNDLKVSLGKKVDEHREAIVAKLAEFGATKMPNLAEEHWTDMFNFMEAI